MRQILLALLAFGMFTSVFAQTEPIEPCCNIIARDIQKNTVVARDNTTGRLYQFKADALDLKSIKLEDAVNISGGKVTAISDAKRMYVTVSPNSAAPCCSVVNIQPDPLDPCCNMVSVVNHTTNTKFTISVPKLITATIKTGHAVSFDAVTNLAIIQSAYGGGGQMNTFGYPATSGEGTTGSKNETEKWVVTPVSAIKGVLGRLDINFPAGVERNILIYQAADNKFLTSVSRNAKTYPIAPGIYRFTLTNVPVENVPIQKGNETRLMAGFLNVVSEGSWQLYSDTKEKQYTSGNKPKKLPLPIGSYQLKLGTQFYPVVIKDGETVEL